MHRLRLASPISLYSLLALALIAAIVPFAPVLGSLYSIWNLKPEYSHGIIIPILSAGLIWQQRAHLRRLPFTGSWLGLGLIAAGLVLRYVGELATLQTLQHYAFLLVIYGLVLALTGPVIFRRLWMPLLILIFAIPLPSFFDNALSVQLQLLSSQLGVWVIRAAGISVLLEGNIIDLGSYQLEVAEACSGLRYLFPLMTLAFIVSYVFRGPMWKRVTIFLASIPITVLMNSLRIGIIGITVERWGRSMAEGALHDFEGWVVFMFSIGALLLTAAGLTRLGRSRTKWSEAFNFHLTSGRPEAGTRAEVRTLADGGTWAHAGTGAEADIPAERGTSSDGAAPAGGGTRANAGTSADTAAQAAATGPLPAAVPRSFLVAAALVLVSAVAGVAIPAARVSSPPRVGFDEFPTKVGDWVGQRDTLQPVYLDALALDDYVLATYRDADSTSVNFYSAYYRAQDSTRAIHSPHDCIPGGGWEIRRLERRQFPAVGTEGSFPINRAVIQMGPNRQIVYYWFQERGRHLTNEYVARWFLFWDALTRHRTDGALVRFVASVPEGASESNVDARMMSLAAQIVPTLGRYIPD
jgi:EpsI family protein